MHYYEVAPNQIVRAGSDSFTYSSEESVQVGQIVSIEVGKKQLIGLVLREVKEPSYPTKRIVSIVEATPLPQALVEVSLWIAQYYVTPLALVLQTVLPRGITKKRRSKEHVALVVDRDRTNIVFNEEQQEVLDVLAKAQSGSFLLQGVTGSGKTAIYIEMAKRATAIGQSVIILVPEIALTAQLIAEFSQHFKDILVTHSSMGESERHTIWREALRADGPRVIVGPRSALFTPLRNVGLIVVDEAHEPSFKQEQSPRYSALRVATMLGRFHQAKVIFGSATPNISDRYLAEKSANPILRLTKPARLDTLPPVVSLVNMTDRTHFGNHRFLSKQLIEQITQTLENGKQTLIFHNRRGSASTTLCENCGWTAQCPRCFVPLVLHIDQHELRCHICNYSERVPTSCPVCHHADIIHKGIGTKLIESELRKLFPQANIARFDADNTDKETVNARYDELYSGVIDIAIGTQVVAKGLDLPHLRTVGVIQADSGLALPDFGASERTFELLAQVVGRVGRNEHVSHVIVQSYQPTHPSVMNGIAQDYESFYASALLERSRGIFPPFTYLLKLTCTYKTEAAAIRNAQLLTKKMKQHAHLAMTIFGPTPAFYERKRDAYRWQLILKSPKREYLVEALRLVPTTHWQFELDPTSLL